ncbi:MAG: DUF3450 domain-containing protein [Bdellovibrionales bacterium]
MNKYSILVMFILVVSQSFAEPPKKVLEKATDVQAKSDAAGRASQKKVDAYADKTDSDLREYKATLKQIENMKAYNQQMRDLIESQVAEMSSIKEKMKNVSNLKKEVLPLVAKMAGSIKEFVKLDVPFLKEERAKRMAEIDLLMSRADVSTSEKFRRVLEAYQIENEYGRTIEAYNGKVTSPSGDEISVEFLRVGRLALMYRGLDGKSFGRWDKVTSKFVDLERTYKGALKEGLRVAKKQKAPTLLTVPVVKSAVEG